MSAREAPPLPTPSPDPRVLEGALERVGAVAQDPEDALTGWIPAWRDLSVAERTREIRKRRARKKRARGRKGKTPMWDIVKPHAALGDVRIAEITGLTPKKVKALKAKARKRGELVPRLQPSHGGGQGRVCIVAQRTGRKCRTCLTPYPQYLSARKISGTP